MFVRKKKNPSGVVSVQIIDKSSGKYHIWRTVGSSSDVAEIDDLYYQGKKWISEQKGERDMFLEHARQADRKTVVEGLLNKVEHILLNGRQLILNPVYENIGFSRINNDILKHLVVSRICQPQSKVATVDYLKSYFDEDVDLNKIYRYLDKLSDTQKDKIQSISVEHTRKVLGGKIGVVFYDVTTLYFETDIADDLRKTGFSKDGKHSQPQIVLGLLVSDGGYPLAYSIHEGNKYEGHTMLPVVKDFVQKFDLTDFVVVADSGLMNAENITELEKNGYKYIIGARIKSENKAVTEWIYRKIKQTEPFMSAKKTAQQKLILGYSEQRAKKDAYNREKRTEAHVCICFVAYKVYKELERILKTNSIKISVDKVLNIAKTITTIKVKLHQSNETLTRTMLITEKHRSIAKLFDQN